MLDADEVDDDFFTPRGSTTLANIFGSTSIVQEENPTLKYVAPTPQDVETKESELSKQNEPQTKASECIFAVALFAYEFISSNYVPRGKLGFAIMKIFTPLQIRLVLYDSSKNTLSQATISSKLEVILQNNNYITYVDDSNKNWSLVCNNSQGCLNIIKELENHNVKVTYENAPSSAPPPIQPKPPQLILNKKNISSLVTEQSDRESDTDSSMNKKTKASILSRMAMMGQSILPPQSLNEHTSDSSDTNDYDNHKNVRHKPIKSNIKKIYPDKVTSDAVHQQITGQAESSALLPISPNDGDIIPFYTAINGQLVPLAHTNVLSNMCENISINRNENVSVILSEQRISNSELRINITRMSEKVDKILDNFTSHERKDVSDTSSFTNDIYRKLLTEYENKIKDQGERIRLLEQANNQQNKDDVNENIIKQLNDYNKINETYKQKIIDLENEIVEKDKNIDRLQNELASSKSTIGCTHREVNELIQHNESLAHKIETLEIKIKEQMDLKDNYSAILSELDSLKKKNTVLQTNFEKTIKGIMNTTFHTLSANFESNDNYTGENIKQIIATVIKKITIKNLSE